jgi:Holliday junction resolvase
VKIDVGCFLLRGAGCSGIMQIFNHHERAPAALTQNSSIQKHPPNIFYKCPKEHFLFQNVLITKHSEAKIVSSELDRIRLRRWRKRGFYSETVLVKLLQKKGYNAVRVPVSNPSLNPLPDIMARKGQHLYAFEVKNATYYAYFPKQQIDKLFRFLDEFIPSGHEYKHAVVAAHLGKRWLFKEIGWVDWEKGKLPEKVRILKRDRGNLNIDTCYPK